MKKFIMNGNEYTGESKNAVFIEKSTVLAFLSIVDFNNIKKFHGKA